MHNGQKTTVTFADAGENIYEIESHKTQVKAEELSKVMKEDTSLISL